jgi:hypothetical protein
MSNRRNSLVLAALLAGVMSVGVLGEGRAFGQSQSLPSTVINTQAAFDSSQIATVDPFVKTAFAQIINGTDPAAIAKGRKALLGQFGGGASSFFTLGYSKLIIDTVISNKVLDPSKPLSQRLNAVIVLTNCIDERMPAVIDEALKDPSPAVKYWAAIAANRFLDDVMNVPAYKSFNNLASPKQQQVLLKGLKGAGGDSPTGLIADQVLLALSRLTISDATTVVLARLNERVLIHARTPNPDITYDYRALVAFVTRTGGNALAADEMRELARLTYREMLLSVEVLEKRNPSPQERDLFMAMLKTSDKWLSWACEGLLKSKAPVQPVPSLMELAALNQWSKIKLALIDFRDKVLLKEPVGLKPEEVETELIKQ